MAGAFFLQDDFLDEEVTTQVQSTTAIENPS